MIRSIILIGMPACGKSTLGVVMAKHLGYDFIDTDILIQKQRQSTLPRLIERFGVDGFLDIEGEVLSHIAVEHPSVIATGGSAVHRANAMEHLRNIGTVVYLKTDLDTLKARINAPEERGVAMKKGTSLDELFALRAPLYEKYAHIIVDEKNDCQSALIGRLLRLSDEIEGRAASSEGSV